MSNTKINLGGPWSSKADVLRYLDLVGWAVKKQTFYNHVNPKHKDFKLNAVDGLFQKDQVDKYATSWLVMKSTGLSPADESSGLAKEKIEKEIEKLDLDLKIKRFNFDKDLKKYIHRDLIELEFAARAGVLDSGFNHQINTLAPELVALVNGDQGKASELMDRLRKSWNILLNNYAKMDDVEVFFDD